MAEKKLAVFRPRSCKKFLAITRDSFSGSAYCTYVHVYTTTLRRRRRIPVTYIHRKSRGSQNINITRAARNGLKKNKNGIIVSVVPNERDDAAEEKKKRKRRNLEPLARASDARKR